MSYLGGRTIYIDSDGNEHFDYDRDYEPKPITNVDRIRAMSDEELADWICEVQDGESLQRANYLPSLSKGFWLKWLKREADHA